VLFRAELRHRWRSWLLLALLVALVSGLVLAGVAAGRRTTTAFPRYLTAHGYDAFLYAARPIPTLTTLPEVASAAFSPIPANGIPTCAGCRPVNINYFSVFEFPPEQLLHTVKLVAGSMPDPSDPRQVLASFTLQRDYGLHVGSVIRVPFASASQRNEVLGNANIVPNGPTVAFHVVGIEAAEIEFPATNSPSYDLYTTPAFAHEYNPKTVLLSSYWVRLRHGAADIPRFQTQARALGGLSVSDLDTQAAAITTSIHPQAVGWWILAGLAALVGLVVVGQALARQATIEADTYATLTALGVGRRQLVLVGMARTMAIGLAGVIGGVVVAFALSPLTPVGEARLAEPSTGYSFDWFVLLLGALAALAVILVLGSWPAVRMSRVDRTGASARRARPSRIVMLLSGAAAPPSALIGVRHALERGLGRTSVPVGSALLGSILAVTALCATAVFGASLTHLTTTPALYGQPFDAYFGVNGTGSTAEADQLLSSLERGGAISTITAGISGDVAINGRTVDALAGQSVRGPLLLTTVSGRLPTANDEVTLGATTMRQVGARVGSLVRVTIPQPQGGSRTVSDRVVGSTSFPPDFGTGGLGTGAVFSFGGLLGSTCPPGGSHRTCELQTVTETEGVFLVRVEPGARGQSDLTRLARAYPSEVEYPSPPTDLVNFGQAVNFPLIMGLVLILFGAATLTHVLVVSVTRRRREMGLLKALGFIRRQVAFTLAWQTTTVAVIGIVVGVPAGIAIGRLVWRVFADNLGVVPVPVVAGWVIVAVALGTLVVANLLAIGPALVAARSRPTSLLRSE
jgi:hypothetical protein